MLISLFFPTQNCSLKHIKNAKNICSNRFRTLYLHHQKKHRDIV
jgi:hypothetical protein